MIEVISDFDGATWVTIVLIVFCLSLFYVNSYLKALRRFFERGL